MAKPMTDWLEPIRSHPLELVGRLSLLGTRLHHFAKEQQKHRTGTARLRGGGRNICGPGHQQCFLHLPSSGTLSLRGCPLLDFRSLLYLLTLKVKLTDILSAKVGLARACLLKRGFSAVPE